MFVAGRTRALDGGRMEENLTVRAQRSWREMMSRAGHGGSVRPHTEKRKGGEE